MIATGGTIACRRTESGLKPLLGSDELLKYVPAVGEVCKADTLQLYNLDSTDIPKECLQWANCLLRQIPMLRLRLE